MARTRSSLKFALARMWAYPLWYVVMHSRAANCVQQDVDWWIECINDEQLFPLDDYGRFAYLTAALTEFRTLVHYRLRTAAPTPLRVLLRELYRPRAQCEIEAYEIGPAFYIQHGVATVVGAEAIGSYCWINQQVTLGSDARGRMPRVGNHVRIYTGAIVLGGITLHDGATIGANATVIHDVGPGETVVAPLATPLIRRGTDGVAPA